MKVFKVPSVFEAIDKVTAPMKKIGDSVRSFVKRSEEDVAKFERKWRNFGNASADVAKKAAIAGAVLMAPLIVAARDAITFEDQMADVAKTTGLAGKELDVFGKQLLGMAPDTRTSIEELQQIAAIGGQMGVAKTELVGFTDSVNKFNVALGSDFAGGVEEASRSIAGLKTLFKETRGMSVAESITKTGSAINALSAKGVQVPELTDFINRVGAMPDAIKPAITDVAALGAVLNKSGIASEVSARGVGDILLTAAQNLPAFAKTMGITKDAAQQLINTNPTAFISKFAASLNGMDAVQLAKTLKGLKIGDAGSIKTVGALSANLGMLAEFQALSSAEFQKGTSLLDEYNVKNNTAQANIQKGINNFKALSITIGTELLPILNDVLKAVMPVLKGFLDWAKSNPGTVKTILILIGTISILSFVVSGVATALSMFSSVMLIASNATKLVTAAQWLWNAAMTANPIVLIIVGVGALIYLVVQMIKHWDEWGASVSFVLGPLGTVIQMVMAFRENWDLVKKAFTEGSILDGIIAIGKVLLDAFMMPMYQIAKIIHSMTGAEWASNAMKGIEMIRGELGLKQVDKPVNQDKTKTEVLSKSIEEKRQNVGIEINDKTGSATVQSDNSLKIPVKLTSTVGAF